MHKRQHIHLVYTLYKFYSIHLIYIIEWSGYTLNAPETGSFIVSNTELEDLFVVKYVAYIYSSKFIQLHQC